MKNDYKKRRESSFIESQLRHIKFLKKIYFNKNKKKRQYYRRDDELRLKYKQMFKKC